MVGRCGQNGAHCRLIAATDDTNRQCMRTVARPRLLAGGARGQRGTGQVEVEAQTWPAPLAGRSETDRSKLGGHSSSAALAAAYRFPRLQTMNSKRLTSPWSVAWHWYPSTVMDWPRPQ